MRLRPCALRSSQPKNFGRFRAMEELGSGHQMISWACSSASSSSSNLPTHYFHTNKPRAFSPTPHSLKPHSPWRGRGANSLARALTAESRARHTQRERERRLRLLGLASRLARRHRRRHLQRAHEQDSEQKKRAAHNCRRSLSAHFTPKFLSLRGAPLRSAQDAGALEGAPRKTPALRHS